MLQKCDERSASADRTPPPCLVELPTDCSGWRSKLSYLVMEDEICRELVIGTARFLTQLGVNLGLSMQSIAVALVYLHHFYCTFKFTGSERKLVAGACLLLSWKYWEDFEGVRHARKLSHLPRLLYRLQKEGPSARSRGNSSSSSRWILSDGGKECLQIRDRLRVYENALLRAIDYKIGPVDVPFMKLDAICRRLSLSSPMWRNAAATHMTLQPIRTTAASTETTAAAPHLSSDASEHKSCGSAAADMTALDGYALPPSAAVRLRSISGEICNSCSEEDEKCCDKSLQHHLYSVALGVCVDFLHWPLCLDYTSDEIAIAAAWKAGAILGLPFVRQPLLSSHVMSVCLPDAVQREKQPSAAIDRRREEEEWFYVTSSVPHSSTTGSVGTTTIDEQMRRSPSSAAAGELKRGTSLSTASLSGPSGTAAATVLPQQLPSGGVATPSSAAAASSSSSIPWLPAHVCKGVDPPRIHMALRDMRQTYTWQQETESQHEALSVGDMFDFLREKCRKVKRRRTALSSLHQNASGTGTTTTEC